MRHAGRPLPSEELSDLKGISPGSQDQNLVLTVLCVPSFPGSGREEGR